MEWNEDIPDAGGGEVGRGGIVLGEMEMGHGMGMMGMEMEMKMGKGISRLWGEGHATCW